MHAPKRNRYARLAGPALLLGLVGLVAGCGPAESTGQAPSADRADDDIPSIYIDRKVEHLSDAVNDARQAYEQHVAVCEQAGTSVKPLDPAELDLVGTERWQLWRMPGHLAYRREIYTVKTGDVRTPARCHFDLAVSGSHVYQDRERSLVVDLATGEEQVDVPDPEVLEVDANVDSEDLEKWRGWQGPAETFVQGQPCREWRSPRGDIACYWTGGTEWGFSHVNNGIFAAHGGLSPDSIILEARPAPGATGDKLTTTRFDIGVTMDPASLLPRNSEARGGQAGVAK